MIISHDLAPAVAGIFRAVLQASWQGALAIALVLLVRRILGTRVPARWHYLLWFLVLARLLLPTGALPHSPASLENISTVARPFVRESVALPQATLTVADFASPPKPVIAPPTVRNATPPPPAISPWVWAASVWLGGVFLLAGWLVAGVVGLRRRLRRETAPVQEEVRATWHACCRRWLRRVPPDLLSADWVGSPALVGWWRPTLLIPRHSLDSFSTRDWEHVFAHEIAHLRWRDHWTQLLLLAGWCVHWFNPVVWFGFRRLRADRELAADEWVLRHLDDGQALAYGETLFKTVTERSSRVSFRPGLVGISEDGTQIKQRLRRITAFLPQRRVVGSLAGMAAVLVLATVVLGQGTSNPAKSLSAKPDATPALASSAPLQTEQSLRDELLVAARAGDAKGVAALLDSKESKFRAHTRSLALASLDDLLRHGEVPAFTTLYDALQLLPLDQGNWKPSDALLLALVESNRTESLDALLARGLDLKRLSETSQGATAPTAAWIERRVAGVTKLRADIAALEKAAGDGDLDAIHRLLDTGVDVNVVGPDHNTPLLRAVFKNRLEAAQLLLDRGAQVDKPRLPGWDYTPLCLVNSVPMAELLKKNGANVHAKLFSRDVSILTYVAYFANSEVVEWFLQQGLDPKMIGDNHKNLLFGLKDGRTAKLLLDAGVDPNQVDDSGNPPICYARSGAVAQALVEHGAKVTGFKRSLLPNMVSYGFAAADAIAVVLKAGADHDPATLREALGRAERSSSKDYPEKEKVKQLLLASGAQPIPPSEGIRPTHHHEINVSAADGTLLGGDSTQVHVEQTFESNGKAHTSIMGENVMVRADGTAPLWIDAEAATASLVATSEGFATAYAGPFTPPTKEKLDGVRFRLERGYRASVETVDDAGQPIAGALLTAWYPGPPKSDFGAVKTDAAGRAVFDHVVAAPLTVQASADGYESDTITAIGLQPEKPYRWTLKKASPLPGLATDAITGQPIAAAKIKLAGVRGPHEEIHADPEAAPVLAVSDAQGRFALTSLRTDSVYDLYVEAPGHGGVTLYEVRTGQPGLKAALGPELTVRGKVIHFAAGQVHTTLSYSQTFKIGGGNYGASRLLELDVSGGEASFVIPSLYDADVDISSEHGSVRVSAKDLPKAGLVIDLAPSPPATTPVATARVVNAQGQPVAGASIQPYTQIHGNTETFPATEHKKTHTDEEGRFSYAVPGFTKVGVMVVARGYARRLAMIPYDGSSPDVVLGLGVEVAGRLLKEGQPVPGIEVGIAQTNHASAQFLGEIVAKTDQDGNFVLLDVAPGEQYEIHAKRDSLRALGVTRPQQVTTGAPGTILPVGDLQVEPGVVVTGRIMLPDGSLPDPEYDVTYPDGRREREANRSVQLHVGHGGTDDFQYIDLQPDLRFSFPALPDEEINLSAWVPGYKLRSPRDPKAVPVITVKVSPGVKAIEMVYDPESAEAKERAAHPVFEPPSTPTPAPPSAAQLEADAKAAQGWADKLAAQPHRSETEWREQLRRVTVGMTFEEVRALLPAKTVSIDYLQRDEYDEESIHTSFYALDGEYAVALTFDFKGDEAWNAAGQPKPRPKVDENHLIRPPILMRHDRKPDKDNEIYLEKAHKV